MRKIIYKKQDLTCVGTTQQNTTIDWEIQNNVIPNFGGIEYDYETLETNLTRFHLENIDGKVVAIEDKIVPTIEEIRSQRNRLLIESDWTQVLDSPLSELQLLEWAAYRQALRDFPATVDLNNIVWPTKPQ